MVLRVFRNIFYWKWNEASTSEKFIKVFHFVSMRLNSFPMGLKSFLMGLSYRIMA